MVMASHIPTTPPPAYTTKFELPSPWLAAAGPSSLSPHPQEPSTSFNYLTPPTSPPRGSRGYGPTPLAIGGHIGTCGGSRQEPPVFGGAAVLYTVRPAAMPMPGGGMNSHVPLLGPSLPLPYYDPTSPHSILQARSRARWRFFEAVFWALMIWFMAAIFWGAGSAWDRDTSHRRRGHPHGYIE